MELNIKQNKIIRNKEFIRTTNKKINSYIKNLETCDGAILSDFF